MRSAIVSKVTNYDLMRIATYDFDSFERKEEWYIDGKHIDNPFAGVKDFGKKRFESVEDGSAEVRCCKEACREVDRSYVSGCGGREDREDAAAPQSAPREEAPLGDRVEVGSVPARPSKEEIRLALAALPSAFAKISAIETALLAVHQRLDRHKEILVQLDSTAGVG